MATRGVPLTDVELTDGRWSHQDTDSGILVGAFLIFFEFLTVPYRTGREARYLSVSTE